MNAEDSLKLARRFIGLPLEKRQMFLQALHKEGVDFSRFPIPAGVEAEDRQALSYAQQRMWFLWQLDPASGAYNLPGAVRLKGALSLPAIEQAFASLVARHETLRTVFQRQADDRLLQVAAQSPLVIEQSDLSALAPAEREQAVTQAATRQSLLPFDLANGPLLRVQLLKLAEQEHVLLLTLHHIVSDGWSMNVLIDEFIRCYDAHERHEPPQLAPLPIQYSDYALWQRRWLEAGEQARQLEYWQTRLGDEHPVLELPLDHPRPAMPSYQGTRHDFAIDPALAAQLRSCAQKHNVTLFMLLLGAFNVLLHRYTGQGDIRVGVPIANRNRSEVEGLIGFFVNTQVLRTELTGQTRVDQLLQGIKEHALGAQAHQELPFERLVEALKVERSLSHTPLFQVMYNHQPQVADIAAVNTASGLELSLVQWQGRTTQFDLSLDTFEKSGTLHAALTYANDLFDAVTIERMAGHWLSLLQAMVADGSQRIGELPMLAADEQRVLVHGWNQTHETYTTERGIHHLIEDQVQRTPHGVALVFGPAQLTYRQLDNRANQLAHALREKGVGPDVLVGICIERSIEMVVGLLAILKAGGAYVPLDPEYPRERLAYMIEDSGIGLLLSQQSLLATLPVEGLNVIALDQAQGWLDGYSREALAVNVHALNLAYVIYTSGSTGKPKGAGNSHRALVNRLCWMQQAYGLDASDAVLQKTPFSFDVSVWEFFWPLMSGARLVVAAPGEHREPARLIETIGEHAITTLHFVPSMLQAFIHEPGVQACASLKRIVCSGEALALDAQLQVFAKLPGSGLYNLYGPTEAAIDVTHWTCIDEGADSVPIGRPIANLATYVLDAQLNPVPAGVAGELYLGGTGLARSYHRRPALTAERFVPCPFLDGARLYRTGDRVRQRVDGVIEYLGRLDHQVKLRGLRIELGEIETRLMQHPLVREAVVLVQGGKQLVAYLVLEGSEPAAPWQPELKAWLLNSLPEYMVPTHLMPLVKLPVTANGKLDRKALPLPDAAPQQAFVAPENDLQKALAAIWSDVLAVEQVGLEDNFFELGGDSIISIQVVSRARQAGIRLSPRDLFQYQSVRSLALVASFDQASTIDQGPVSGEVILTPVQQGFFEQAIPARQHWNQSLLLTPREPLVAEALDIALTRLINHHDALRLRFVKGADGWQQAHTALVSESGLWQTSAATDSELAALCDEAQRSLDLQQGPLLRAVLVDMADASQRLLLVLHHLVVDGVSWRILLEDLQQAYRAPAQLPSKTSAYQAWAQHLQAHAQTLNGQLPYWQAQSGTADLPCDNPQGGLQNRLGEKIETRLNPELTRQLLQYAPAAYRTQVNDLLLTALARVISRWSGQDAALIQLEGHGREDLFDALDLTRTVGWFTSLFPVRLQAEGELPAAIKSVKEQLRAVPDKGLGYGLLRYLGEPEAREALAGLPGPRITFNYLGQFDRQFNDSALFVPAGESSGQAQDGEAPLANWLTLEGQVYGGELALQWGFSREMFQAATVQRLADDYAVELAALIEHCCATEAGQVTPSDFPLAHLTQQQLDALPVAGPAIDDIYPLSPMQQGMLFHTLYEPQAQAYINQLRLDIEGLDLLAFGRAWQAALDRHDILRSSFHWLGLDSAHQVIHRQADVQLQVIEAVDADLDALADAERERGFELSVAPLFRLMLVRGAGSGWHLIYTSHHILMDGWSNAQLLGEVISHYAGQVLPAPLGQFRDYLGWLQQQSSAADEAFWRASLAPLQVPTLLAEALRPPVDGAGMADHQVILDSTLTATLSEFARQQKITLNTLLQGAWSVLLQRYTGQPCVVFGATVAGRSAPLPGIEQQLGLFINTLPMISAPAPAQQAAAWLGELQALNLGLRDHEHVPLYDIQGWAGQQGAALFDTLLVFENFPVAEALKQGAPTGLSFGQLHNHERTNYPLTLGIELGSSLRLEFSYDRARFSEAQVVQLSANLQHLLVQLAADPGASLGSLQLLDEPGRRAMLGLSQSQAASTRHHGLVHERIAAQAQATPAALAVLAGSQRLSYRELNEQANRLAHRLLEHGVGPGRRVGLAARRGPQLIVSLLAVLKSGAAYVPLDPKYPNERLAYMLADSRLDLLLCETGLLADLPLPESLTRVDFTATGEELAAYACGNPPSHAVAADLAYVIYTSGSTGQPKGVAIDHAALGQFCESAEDYSVLSCTDRVLQFATFSFDGFVEQCYPPLCVGAALVMRGDELWDAGQLAREIVGQGVTLADLPAAYWYLLAKECAVDGRSLGNLRQVHVGGEAMSVEGLRAWHEAGLGKVRLLNTYGPTEATVVSSVHDCQLADASDAFGIPIGRAIAGRALYVLDSAFELLPVGGVGELYIGAPAGLAQGYFDRPALTAERFLPDPFAGVPGARLYRSGDLARYNQHHALEYVGRIDHQVKIRGLRIEMGEIEACLQALPQVHEAAVIAYEGPTGAQLVGYVVAAQGVATESADLATILAQSLPDYMVPGHWVWLDALPLNNNGKLDRRALPAPDLNQPRHAYEAPHSPLQIQLAAIWQAVLQVERVGLNDHFFERGGHSLLATQVISRVRHALKLEVPLKALFEQPTLLAFAAACAGLQVQESLPMLALERGRPMALSSAQERQWFLWQLDPGSAAYHVPTALHLRGSLNVVALEQAFQALVQRHEALRTTFVEEGEQTWQVIQPRRAQVVEQQAVDAHGIAAAVEHEIQRPFDLFNGPLMRVKLLRVQPDHHVLVITQHHIISDGWSMQIIVDELIQLYGAFCAGTETALQELPLQYADYAAWQRQWMAEGESARQLAYWREKLGGEQPVLELPFDFPRPAEQSLRGARLDFNLPAELASGLQALAQREQVTLFVLLLASFQMLLHRYSGQGDIRVGVPVANRNRMETEGLVGFFVNTQVLRAEFDSQVSFRDLLQQVRQSVLDAQTYQDLPFEQLVEALQPERNLSHSPLFQVLFNHQNREHRTMQLPGLSIEGVAWDSGAAQFDLTLDTGEVDGGLAASLTYATDLFETSSIERMARHWLALLQAIVEQPGQPVAELAMLSRDEQQVMLTDWNATAAVYPLETSVQQLIEAQVLKAPDAPALAFGEERLTYAQLNTRANRLAHQLIAQGVGPDVLVGIAVERSIEMVVGLLAVLKAGGAYVPFDPEYPQERLQYMIEDSGIELLLTQQSLLAQLPIPQGVQTLVLDQVDNAGFSSENPPVNVSGENLAYVIYTSGSTGKPKGAGNRHSALTNRLCWMQEAYQLGAHDTVLQKTPFSFDVSVWEFFWPLMTGARLVVAAPGDHRDPARLIELINREHVSTLHFVPSMLQAFMQDGGVSSCVSLKRIVCSGEALPADAQQQVFAKLPGANLYNLYGPTEAAIDVTHWTCIEEGRDAVPIGRPIANLGCYILDNNLEPVPVGVLGELYLGGEGLARGYHRRPALTAERFAVSPFGNGERLYRTGDLARYRADGVIEYAGRIDHQVKLRGLRIELGEIEARLLEHELVREAVVVVDSALLVAYVVLLDDSTLDLLQLQQHLGQALPAYMVPSHVQILAHMPLSPNGKLDRKALPKLDTSLSQQTYVAPGSELEKAVAAIWQEVLEVDEVGLTDNFFALGGHSLLATRVTSRVRNVLGIEAPLKALFEQGTLQGFVQSLVSMPVQPRAPRITRVGRDQALGLSYAQERQWFLWQLEPESAAYHIPTALRLRGPLDLSALQHGFDSLIRRHEALRTRFVQDQERTLQVIQAPFALDIVVESLASDLDDAGLKVLIENEIAQPFNLLEGPLLRVKLLQVDEDDHVLVLTQHHIVSDGASMQVIVGELIDLYGAFQRGETSEQPELALQYVDYALWQRDWMQAGERERQLAYWVGQLGGEQPVLELPLDHPRPAVQSYRGARLDLNVPGPLGRALHAVARGQGVTLFMLLLASFQTLLHRYSGQRDIRVGVPIANRNRVETEGLIGFFVNTQVMRVDIEARQPFSEVLQQVRQASVQAQAHQDLPFEQLVEALAPARSLSRSPLFQVLFNHQARGGQVRSVAGLGIQEMDWDSHTAQFDLTMDTHESADGVHASLTYATDLFDASSIERMARHWLALLQAIVEQPGQPVAELAMLSRDEQQVMLTDWNATAAVYPLETSVQQLIEAQVLKAPDAPALAFGEERLSYAQLNARANRLAHQLIAQGVGPDVLVGIAVERSIEMVVGLLAVLKAGGAYVPFDPEYPQERLQYMIEDSGIELLLTQQSLLAQLPIPQGVQTLVLDQVDNAGFSSENPPVNVSGENLAYVIYTSGSTGKPKGAGNRHSALTNRLCWMQEAYALTAHDTVLQKTPFSFDVSVWEFFWPLMTGARLVVAAPGDHRDPARLIELINREHVSTLHFVPSMLQAFMQDGGVSSCVSLKRIVCSGEALPADAQQQVFAKLPGANLYNLYGPTEAAIDVTHWTCIEEGRDAVPIGRPIANLGCYILDNNLEPVPVGVLGELYLGGEGLARGYHRRPALTAERFAVSPFGNGERLYRTGDLARYRADGVIEYAGRIDHQVKLRGLRIELGEIEARLLEHELVRETAVTVIDGKHLLAYVVLAGETAAWRETLSAHLQRGLPDYMVPNQWLVLEQMPLSPNGKLDRKALPKPEAAAQQLYVAPRSELEQRIAAVWADVLRLEQVGVTDNFFELGGDSIISIQVVGRARQVGIHFTPKELFLHQTVQGLASVAHLGEALSSIDQGPVTGPMPLLPFQQWFFDSAMPEPHHWNQSVLLKARDTLHAGSVEHALQALVSHHDALRLRFSHAAQGWVATHAVTDSSQPLLQQIVLRSSDEIQAACEAAQRSLNLQHGPLLRGLLISLADGSQRLLLVIHHLAVDGVSWRVLLEDLHHAYQAALDGQAQSLPAKTTAFKTWGERLQAYAHGDALSAERMWWVDQLSGANADLPGKKTGMVLRNDQARTIQVHLQRDLTQRLLQQAPVAYRTQVNDLLLTALARVIGRWSGQDSTLIQLEGHGREGLFEDVDLSRSVGWFTTAFPVRLEPAADLAGSIKQIKEQLRAVPNKGIGFGVLRYLADASTRQLLGDLPQPRITFNYLGQLDSQFDDAALFSPATESAGNEQSPLAPLANWLVLNGQVYGGQLSLGWTFSDELFDEATIQRLADEYIGELAALIEHCSDARHGAVTPSDFPLATLNQAQLDALPVACQDIEDIYPLSPMQQGMLFHSLYQQAGGDYINQMRVDVQGLDVERFRAAWQAAVQAHESLRSGFIWDSQQQLPVQIVHRHVEVPFTVHDWQSRIDLDHGLQQLADAEREQGFDLLAAPLLRLVLVRTGADTHALIYTSHHILMDGWSNSQLLGEVLQRYCGELPEARNGRYRDYIAWLQRQDSQAGERFWKEQLATLDEPTRLASTSQAPRGEGYGDHYAVIDAQQTRRLGDFARRQKVTLNTLVQAAWSLLLQRRTGQSTVAFGATVAGRPADVPGALQQVGLFINTLPVITGVSAERRIGDWLQALQSLNLRLREYEHTPLFDIQRWAGQGGEALFDSLLVFENYPVSQALEQGAPSGLSFGQVRTQEQSNYPLTLAVGMEESLSLHYSYDGQFFSRQVIEQISEQLQHLLHQMLEVGAQGWVDAIELFDGPGQQLILKDWNPSASTYPQTACLHRLIEDQVAKAPDAVALVCAGEQLTYGELNRRANRLAHALIAQGVGPEVLVGIAAERSFEMLVGLLAILKAGGAYVPLDPAYPEDRLHYMIEDSGLELLLTQAHLPVPTGVRSLLIEADHPAIEHNPQVAVGPDNLAYVIYTSGSTGKPKGTLLPHRNVLRLFEATQGWFNFGAQDTWTLFHSYAFDFSVWEIFGALLYGGRLVIVPQDVSRSPQAFLDLLCEERVTVLNQTPSAFKQLMQVACADQRVNALRYVVFGGEALEVSSLRPWFERFGDRAPQLINMYGITETTVHVTYRPLSLADLDNGSSSPLGVAIPDLSWYVLDGDLKPVVGGCTGELYIGGAGLARGYLNRADLSSTRFIPDLFSREGGRLYRTGDLARYRADGVVEYMGRIDHQVKIRGFRIELGEIEARLLDQPSVREAVVLAREGAGGTQLVGYVVPTAKVEDLGAWHETLKAGLREDLPEYMVPAHLILLAQMPLTANGKLDRKALPAPDASLLQKNYVAPGSELEHKVAAVWADVLGLEQVGMGDNFFELGGHSLLATQAMLRLREQLGFEIAIKTLFTTADLAEFCQAIQAHEPDFEPIHDVLAKSMEALNRLSADELEKLIS